MDVNYTESSGPTTNSVIFLCMYFMILWGSLGNLLLEDTIERYYYDLEWADDRLGTFLVRGENIVLMGDLVSNYM